MNLSRMIDPFESLRERLAESVGSVPDEPVGEVFMSHEEWERERPDELSAAEAYEQSRAWHWEARHGSLEGWVPARSFPCEGQLRVDPGDQGSLVWPVTCDVCGYEVGVQVQRVAPKRLEEHRLARSGVPSMFAGKAFEPNEAQEPVLRACREWVRGFRRGALPAVALWGSPGRGKSHLLALMVETLAKGGVDAMYRSASELLDELQAGFDTATYEAQWRRVLSVGLLAIDDLGAGKPSDWRKDRLAALVDHRFSRELPLIVATNVPPAGWEKAFGPRTNSRLRGMVIPFHLEGHDWRVGQGVQERLAVGA